MKAILILLLILLAGCEVSGEDELSAGGASGGGETGGTVDDSYWLARTETNNTTTDYFKSTVTNLIESTNIQIEYTIKQYYTNTNYDNIIGGISNLEISYFRTWDSTNYTKLEDILFYSYHSLATYNYALEVAGYNNNSPSNIISTSYTIQGLITNNPFTHRILQRIYTNDKYTDSYDTWVCLQFGVMPITNELAIMDIARKTYEIITDIDSTTLELMDITTNNVGHLKYYWYDETHTITNIITNDLTSAENSTEHKTNIYEYGTK